MIVNVDDSSSQHPTSKANSSKKTQHERPRVCKHYKRQRQSSSLAQHRYIAPPKQAGLKLKSVLGYNGFGRDNMVWKHDTGENLTSAVTTTTTTLATTTTIATAATKNTY